MSKEAIRIDVVFRIEPGGAVPSFIEIEVAGTTFRLGSWVQRGDGLWALRVTRDELERVEKEMNDAG